MALSFRLAELQGDDGFWRSSLLDPLECPNPETTGATHFKPKANPNATDSAVTSLHRQRY